MLSGRTQEPHPPPKRFGGGIEAAYCVVTLSPKGGSETEEPASSPTSIPVLGTEQAKQEGCTSPPSPKEWGLARSSVYPEQEACILLWGGDWK